MNKLISLLFVCFVLLSLTSCSDDEPIEVIVVNSDNNPTLDPNTVETEEQFRIDLVTINGVGSNWDSNNFLFLRIADETNNFQTGSSFRLNNLPSNSNVFYTANRSEWRVFVSQSSRSIEYSTVIKPWDFKVNTNEFSIPINSSGANGFNLVIKGTVVEVEI